jgi:hypothetical protein
MSESKAELEQGTLFELAEPQKPKANVDEIETARKKAFKWEDCAKADEKKIRQHIGQWLKEDVCNPNFAQMLRDIIWEVNGGGQTIKYMHFNEHKQYLRIDNDFWKWAELASNQIQETLELIEK